MNQDPTACGTVQTEQKHGFSSKELKRDQSYSIYYAPKWT